MSFKRVNIKFLDNLCKQQNTLMNRKIKLVNKFINKNESLLDLGVGTGTFIKLVQNKVKKIYGIDIDNESIKIFNKKFKNINKISIKQGNIKEIAKIYNNRKFDYITALDVLEHITKDDAEIVLNSIYQLLKDNGKFIFTGPGIFEKIKILLRKSPTHTFSHSSYGWIKMFTRVGFHVEHIETVEFPIFNFNYLRKKLHLFGKCCIIISKKI